MYGNVLNEKEIVELLLSEQLIITPIMDPDYQIGPTSVDIRLGFQFKVFNTNKNTHLDPLLSPEDLEIQINQFTTAVHVRPMNSFVLHPGEFVLASTLEYFKLPKTLAGRLEGRSTWGRLGLLVHATAGFVDPGFEGSLTFELKNAGKTPIPLYPGVRIAQICFFKTNKTSIPYTEKRGAKYYQKIGTTGSMLHKDPEFNAIRKFHKENNM